MIFFVFAYIIEMHEGIRNSIDKKDVENLMIFEIQTTGFSQKKIGK